MELRKDYLTNDWVIIAVTRGKRPHQFMQQKESKSVGVCYFCPGNENTTPPETGRIEENGKWLMRWFPNKFPAVGSEGDPSIYIENTFYTYGTAVGFHEVIVESPNHEDELACLPAEQIKKLLDIYSERMTILSEQPNVSYVQVFKNHG
ncbi:galactose-1-phosphate uridylyltransferase, partial [Candidatus Woesearchaeota archaeon CG_4_10_14_0_8_um_filter_47_5]